MSQDAADHPATVTGPIRVLHVDDEPGVAETVAAHLEREDDRLSVEVAAGVEEALERLDDAADDVDCVLSDYDMPGRDGLAFFDEVRERHGALPFVLYTGEGSEAVASEAISAGVTDYVRKEPGTEHYGVLANRIVDVVARRRAVVNYREVFEKVPDGILIHDPEAEEFMLDMNRRYLEMYGYDSREAFFEEGFEAIHPEESPYTEERARELLEEAVEEGPLTLEWRPVRADGERFWTEVHLSPAEIDGEQRVLAVVRDITDRKERERALEHQNERLEEIMSVLGHDLRNPLQVVDASLDLYADTSEERHLERGRDAIDRMDRLIDDLLALETDVEAVDLGPVELAEAAESCWATTGMGEATLALETDLRLRADRGCLDRLLQNLFRNAVVHGGDDVTVTVGEPDGSAGFSVADDGEGITPEQRDRIFEWGYTTRDGGTGLGLAIVTQVADAHNWTVDVDESADGGARFTVTGVETA